jgi:GT2 family glycosyltransferase
VPKFSIVIPTFNRHAGLRRCLAGILRLDYPRQGFEVVVIDDGSASSPAAVVDDFANVLDVRLIRQENAGPASARNTGAGDACGDYLVFIDDDCVPALDWLRQFDQYVERRPRVGVGGRCFNRIDSIFSSAHQALLDYLFETSNADPEQAHFCATNNLAVPRKLFLQMGGFDTSFRYAAGEDRELCERWRAHGFELHYLSSARVDHYHALRLASFCRMHFNYGRGARHFHDLPESKSRRTRLKSPRFYLGLLVYPFRNLPGGRAFNIFLLQLLSQGAHTVGYFWERWSS